MSPSGNVEIVRLLINKGAELEACDTDHTPPLHTACVKGHVDCALELLNAGLSRTQWKVYVLIISITVFTFLHFGVISVRGPPCRIHWHYK